MNEPKPQCIINVSHSLIKSWFGIPSDCQLIFHDETLTDVLKVRVIGIGEPVEPNYAIKNFEIMANTSSGLQEWLDAKPCEIDWENLDPDMSHVFWVRRKEPAYAPKET